MHCLLSSYKIVWDRIIEASEDTGRMAFNIATLRQRLKLMLQHYNLYWMPNVFLARFSLNTGFRVDNRDQSDMMNNPMRSRIMQVSHLLTVSPNSVQHQVYLLCVIPG